MKRNAFMQEKRSALMRNTAECRKVTVLFKDCTPKQEHQIYILMTYVVFPYDPPLVSPDTFSSVCVCFCLATSRLSFFSILVLPNLHDQTLSCSAVVSNRLQRARLMSALFSLRFLARLRRSELIPDLLSYCTCGRDLLW